MFPSLTSCPDDDKSLYQRAEAEVQVERIEDGVTNSAQSIFRFGPKYLKLLQQHQRHQLCSSSWRIDKPASSFAPCHINVTRMRKIYVKLTLIQFRFDHDRK